MNPPSKNICIVVDAAEPGHDLLQARIEPGTTSADMLRHFNLRGHLLVPEGTATHLGGDEVLWPHVQDGAKLRATPIAEVGSVVTVFRRVASIFTPKGRQLPPRILTGGAAQIGPTARPLWQERGWQQKGEKLVGSYRTRCGGYFGEVLLSGGDASAGPSFYVFNPPPSVFRSSHAACYRDRGSGRYWIHFNRPPSIDGGITTIESQLCMFERVGE